MTPTPSPADLARRSGPRRAPAAAEPARRQKRAPYVRRNLTAEEAIAPGKLTRAEHFRKLYRVGITLSRMHPHARLVGHDLMWRASHATGELSANYRPSIEQLAGATGLSFMQVDVAIEVLRSRGWLFERVISDGPRAGLMALHLAIPASVLEDIRVMRSRGTEHTPTS